MEQEPGVLRAGALLLDRRGVAVSLGGAALALTRTEFLLLQALMVGPGAVVSRPELAAAARGEGAARRGWLCDRYVYRLRAKLRRAGAASGTRSPVIEFVAPTGYRLTA